VPGKIDTGITLVVPMTTSKSMKAHTIAKNNLQ